jgi:hypothetical protein
MHGEFVYQIETTNDFHFASHSMWISLWIICAGFVRMVKTIHKKNCLTAVFLLPLLKNAIIILGGTRERRG